MKRNKKDRVKSEKVTTVTIQSDGVICQRCGKPCPKNKKARRIPSGAYVHNNCLKENK